MTADTQPDFQQFQRAFALHLRDPHHTPRPDGIPAGRMAVYNELLFNNICGFIDRCFPVSQKMLGKKRWRRLCRTFYRDWPLHTPWFREIPREFVRYLAEAEIRQALPAWLAELAHYEWAELATDIMDTPVPAHDPAGDLLANPVALNPALLNLAYAWPVHRIGPDYRPRKPQPTYLVVHRDANDDVQFSQINAVTGRLLTLLATAPTSGEAAIRQIGDELQHPDPAQLQAHGAALLDDLRRQGILLGTIA
ncbi:MAG: putative DNA-binding domain-containing protein [Azonexus sp.]